MFSPYIFANKHPNSELYHFPFVLASTWKKVSENKFVVPNKSTLYGIYAVKTIHLDKINDFINIDRTLAISYELEDYYV